MTSFLSVGIDVGTTSTHLTFSRLTIVNAALANQSPLPKIEKREIIFQSVVHLTPLSADGNIDAEAVYRLIEIEYQRAAINRDDIKVGAAIVTGETALKRNAREVIEKLCLLSGDLVAVSAGPHLEAVLSARGSGAAAASYTNKSTILNIDIGGGTMNLALYKNGALVSTHCLGIGGRCVQFETFENDRFAIKATNESGRLYLNSLNLPLVGELKLSALLQLSKAIATDVVGFIQQMNISQGLTDNSIADLPLSSIEKSWSTPDEIWLCGGVAEFIIKPSLDKFEFFDLGGLLAEAISQKLNESHMQFKIPEQPIRATVTGAGMYSMQVTGSTIDFDIEHLPLRNIPLIRPFENDLELSDVSQVLSKVESALRRIDPECRNSTVAIEMPPLEKSKDYPSLKNIAASLASVAAAHSQLRPFVIIVREDLGMALGQLFRQSAEMPLIVIDGVITADGDFIDIGKPVSLDENGIARTIPVVLKTLVFGSN